LQLSRLELLDLADPDASTPAGLAHVGDAVRHPQLTLRLYLERPGGRQALDGWADHRTVVLQPEVDPMTAATVRTGPRSELPSVLASVLDLGLRTPPSPRQALVQLEDVRRSLETSEPIPGIGDLAAFWTLQWTAQGASVQDGMTVLDQGVGRPIWLARSVAPDQILFEDVGALGVWQQLGDLMRLAAVAPEAPPTPETPEDEHAADERPHAAPR
jgi:hypothetical protein